MALTQSAKALKDVWGKRKVRTYRFAAGWTDADTFTTDLGKVEAVISCVFTDSGAVAADSIAVEIVGKKQLRFQSAGTTRAFNVTVVGY